VTVTPSISIVIRVRNEAASLKTVLCAICAQAIQPVDIVIVDNASTDGTRELVESYGAKVLGISKEEFTYGRALNRGIRAAEGEYIVILSAHALPVGADFLGRAVEPFHDPLVAAVRCLHVGNRDELRAWMESRMLDLTSSLRAVTSSGPVACACAIRKRVWETIPFDEKVTAIEDKLWALDVLKSGYRIANSQALYLYLRDIGLFENLAKMNRDRLEYFRATGVTWQEPPVSMKRLLASLFYHTPRRALRTAAQQTLLYAYLKTIPLQARRKPKLGSIR
jgi:glycosyltransferase involved in cell wall biosynthesis